MIGFGSPIDVIVVDDSQFVTGALKSIVGVAEVLRDRGEFRFQFVLDRRGAAREFVSARGFICHSVRFARLRRSPSLLTFPFRLLANLIVLRRIIRASGARLIHVNDIYNLTGVTYRWLCSSVRLVQHCRLLRNSYLGIAFPWLARIVSARADALIAASRAVKSDLQRCGVRCVHVVHNAVFRPVRHPPIQYRRGTERCRFLYVGNYIRGKGHDLAIRAMALAIQSIPQATLKMVGVGVDGSLDSVYRAEIDRLISDFGLSDKVRIEGACEDVEAEMKAADVVLNLSLSESFSMVCLEALRFGLPLIAAASGGPNEIVIDRKTGILVPVGDVNAAAKAMIELCLDPDFAQRLGRAGAIDVAVRYDAKTSADALAAIYRSVMMS